MSHSGPHAPGGQPLAPHIKEAIEHSFLADFSHVRVHLSPLAQRNAAVLSARAFTYGHHIFLGSGEHAGDLALMAHEAAHVVQQQSAPSLQAWSPDRGNAFEREADHASAAVRRGENFAVQGRVGAPRVQRLGLHDALNFFADAAYNIPGYRMFTMVLGVNPINMEKTDRSPGNVLRAMVEFIPGGHLITEALDRYAVLDKVGGWMQQQLDTLGIIGSSIRRSLDNFLDSLSWTDVFHLGDLWDRAKHIFTDPITRIKNFAAGLLEGIWKFVRDAILKPLAGLAAKTSGWDLLCAVLGSNPITGESVPRTPQTLIGGFMKLIHEEEVWENIKKANAIARAWAWFQGTLAELMAFVKQIPALFMDTLHSLEWSDILNLPQGFRKVAVPFGTFLGRFVSWAGDKVWTLLQLIFEVVAPAVMPYLKKVGASFKKILKDPIAFMHHLIDAGKLGFENFAAHFTTHLKTGLIDWLTGSLPGVYIPKAISLPEVGRFAMSVLGISWAQIRGKIVKALGPNGETIMSALEKTFDIVVALVKGGPAAAWELIKEKLTDLKDTVIGGITSFVVDTIVKKAVPKIISMFIPGAGFISAILSIYDTVMVFVQKLSKIIAAVKAFVDSIMAIAAGQIESAANKVENTLAGIISLAISFLAGFLGLGNIASKILAVVEKIRAAVDKALDTAVNWIVDKAKKLWGSVKGAAAKVLGWLKMKVDVKGEDESHVLSFRGDASTADVIIASTPAPLSAFLDAQEADADKQQLKVIAAVRKQLAKVTKLIASAKPGVEDEKLQKDIETEMNALGSAISPMLSGSDLGSKSNPAPLNYEKRRSASYPVFYLATGKMKGKSQDTLKKNFPGDAGRGKIWRYLPNQSQNSPGDEQALGLESASQIEVGRVIQFDEKGKRAGGVPAFRNLTVKYGFNPSDEGWDIDHVVELQVGGEDKYANLWPLPLGENRSSGSIIKNAETKDGKGKTVPVIKAFETMKKKGKDLWLIIVSTRQR